MYYEISTSKVFADLKSFYSTHRDTSFGDLGTPEGLEAAGLAIVKDARPGYDPQTEKLVPTGVTATEDGYSQTYKVEAKELEASDAMALTIQKFDTWLTRHLDKVANQKRYDGRVTCALRAGYPGPFQAEGIAFALWMDTCNYQAYQLMSAVLAGTKELPSSEEAFLSEFPQMVWPEPS